MPSDTTGPSGRDDPRRSVIIDLPADEVGRKPAGDDASFAGNLAGSGNMPNAEPDISSATGSMSDTGIGPSASEAGAPSSSFDATPSDPAGVAPAEIAPARRRTSFAALLTAALLGGGIAGGGLYALDRAGILPLGLTEQEAGVDAAAEVRRLEAQIAELRAASEATPAAPAPVDIGPVREQIAALEQSIAELRQQPANAPADGPAYQEVQNRLAQLETTAAALQSAPPPSIDPAVNERLTELTLRMEELQTAIRSSDPAPQMTELGTRIDEVDARIAALEARPPVDLSGLERGLGDLRGQAEQLASRIEVAPTEERVSALEATLAETSRNAELATRLGPAVAADGLAAAVQSGAPFVNEIAALRRLGLDEATLAALEPHAQTGLPTLPALQAEFENRAAEADLSVPAPAGAGPLDRLVQSARGLVEVRSAEAVAGNDPSALVANVRAALKAGDLKAALETWNQLPERVKGPTASWARSVEARVTADDLIARLRSEALSRLGDQG